MKRDTEALKAREFRKDMIKTMINNDPGVKELLCLALMPEAAARSPDQLMQRGKRSLNARIGFAIEGMLNEEALNGAQFDDNKILAAVLLSAEKIRPDAAKQREATQSEYLM